MVDPVADSLVPGQAPAVSAESLLDAYLPEYDVSDSVAQTVHADVAATWSALLEADLIEVGRRKPLVGALGFARALPEIATHLLHGEHPGGPPEHLRLLETTKLASDQGGWVLLGERPQAELALGLIGKFWRPVIEYARVEPDQLRDFAEPGWAKTVYELSVEPLAGGRTLLTGTMRTQTTDDRARRWFRRYWTFGVGSGAHLLVGGLLEVVRDAAEAGTPSAATAAS